MDEDKDDLYGAIRDRKYIGSDDAPYSGSSSRALEEILVTKQFDPFALGDQFDNVLDYRSAIDDFFADQASGVLGDNQLATAQSVGSSLDLSGDAIQASVRDSAFARIDEINADPTLTKEQKREAASEVLTILNIPHDPDTLDPFSRTDKDGFIGRELAADTGADAGATNGGLVLGPGVPSQSGGGASSPPGGSKGGGGGKPPNNNNQQQTTPGNQNANAGQQGSNNNDQDTSTNQPTDLSQTGAVDPSSNVYTYDADKDVFVHADGTTYKNDQSVGGKFVGGGLLDGKQYSILPTSDGGAFAEHALDTDLDKTKIDIAGNVSDLNNSNNDKSGTNNNIGGDDYGTATVDTTVTGRRTPSGGGIVVALPPGGGVGPAGPAGPTGGVGPAGPAGAAGAAGGVGPAGPAGPAGVAGAVGATGATGAKGDKGEKGDPGITTLMTIADNTPVTDQARSKLDRIRLDPTSLLSRLFG